MNEVEYTRTLADGRVVTIKGLVWWSYRTIPPTLMGPIDFSRVPVTPSLESTVAAGAGAETSP